MAALNDIETWRIGLGLMPVPLLPEGTEHAFVLLNGTRGNFCLDLDPAAELADRRSEAWSANVGHFVSVLDGKVAVQRWDTDAGAYQFRDAASVGASLRAFHNDLERLTLPSDLSVVAHSLRVFRSLRAALGKRVDGTKALKAFLYLLGSAAANVDRGQLRLRDWGLPEDAEDVVGLLEQSEWDGLQGELTRGLPLHGLRPDFRIVLRHASGPLFQEAHYLAQFSSYDQPLLPGLDLVPEPVNVVPETDAVGLFFTPPALARTVVEEGLAASSPTGKIRVFDPACGSGEFLREFLRQARLLGYAGKIELLGWDVSPAACAMTRFTLSWESRSTGDDPEVEWQVTERDALEGEWPEVDLILMNPPFLSVREMTAAHKERLREVLGDLARGRFELATVFVWKAAQALARQGVLATVVPASLLEGKSFAALRGGIAAVLSPHLVARLGSQELFQQAQVDAGLYIGRKNGGNGIATAVWADHRMSSSSAALRTLRRLRATGGLGTPYVEEGFSIYPNPDAGTSEGGWAPRPYHEWSFRRRAGNLPTVGESFKVEQGALTGYNRAFLVGSDYWKELPEKEQLFFRPAVLNESIKHGRLSKTAYVFFPYGDYRIEEETVLWEKVPTFARDRLEPHRGALNARKQLPKSTRWWELTRPRNWQIEPVRKIVSTYFGGSGSFAWDESAEFIVVQGYAWRPKGRGRNTDRAVWLAYLALLNSLLFEDLLAATSDNVGGGQWNLSIRYVKHIPLPELPVTGERSRLTGQLAELGATIHEAGLHALSEEQRHSLRELVEAAYGVPGTPTTAHR